MAKQSGIHQIKGKIGEHSYYRQTGVSGGLIRSINQGLSARVKADAAYANTRLNNLEFGAAANTAALLGQMVTPKFRPMILPFSQSKMAKEILRLARQNVSPWGQRTVTSAQTPQIAATLAAMSKRDFSQFVSVNVTRTDASTINLQMEFSAEQATFMAGLGINSLLVNGIIYNLATGKFNVITGEMSTGYLENQGSIGLFDDAITEGTAGSGDDDLSLSAFVPAADHAGHQIAVFVVLPQRQVDSVKHILQEYCSFTAMPIPATV